jgi:hypothetical protein
MKRNVAIGLALAVAALLGPQRSLAQTAVEAIPRAGVPMPQVSVPGLDTGSSPTVEAPGAQDEGMTAQDSDSSGDSDTAPDTDNGSQAQPDDSSGND